MNHFFVPIQLLRPLLAFCGFGLFGLFALPQSLDSAQIDRPTPEPPAASHTIADHPGLKALTSHHPKDLQGNPITFQGLSVDPGNDPLKNRYALFSRDKSYFTIVPKASLLIGQSCSTTSDLILDHLPGAPSQATYQALPDFIGRENSITGTPLYQTVPIPASKQGYYGLNPEQVEILATTHAASIMILVDSDNHLPIAKLHKQKSPPLPALPETH